ncbi:amino acid ABC transporter permease [Enterococcus termitis]
MSFSQQMSQLLTGNNLRFLFDGLKLTLYISFVSIVLSTIFGTILAVLRNQKSGPLKFLASLYIEIVRNIPNLLWIYVIF